MDTTQLVKAVIAGLCFGAWPLLMNRSGLSGTLGAGFIAGFTILFISPLVLRSVFGGDHMANANWWFAIGASIASAVGMVVFNSMLSKASTTNVSMLFTVVIVLQTVTAAAYQAVVSGSLAPMKAGGFILALLGAVLLTL